MAELSIIVPVYNGEEYIVEALESYFSQSDESIQVIVVNDGSTDNTYELVKAEFGSYIENNQLCLVHKENGGVSSARNTALSHATGAYLTFFDGDDLLLDGYVTEVLNAIRQHSPDVVEFGFKMFVDRNAIPTQPDKFVYNRFGLNDFDCVRDDVFERSIWYPCIRVFRRELFVGNQFPEGVRFCEDMMVLTKIYESVKTVFHIEKSLYGYRINESGATRNVRPDYFDNLIVFYETLPKDNKRYMDYLKINISYLMYRCFNGKALPYGVKRDFYLLFIKYLFDRKLSLRKKIILGFPGTYRLLKKVLKK